VVLATARWQGHIEQLEKRSSSQREISEGDEPSRDLQDDDPGTYGAVGLAVGREGVTHIAEATGIYWKLVWHILSDGEFELVLANAAHVKNVPGRKTDVNDATWLADLMAHGLIRPSFVPDEPTQQMRDLLRNPQAVRARTPRP
jgi:transposase